MSINQRIKILIDSLEDGVSSRFAKRIGVAPTVVNYLLPGNRESKPGYDLLVKIKHAYPQLRTDWLIEGEGNMLKEAPPAGNSNSGNQIKGSVSAIGNNSQAGSTDLQAEVEKLRMEIEHLNERLKDKDQRLKDKEDLIEILKLQGKNTQT